MERQPARYKNISEIDPESDIWVRIGGIVVDNGIIDDGTGMARFEYPEELEKGKFYVMVCRVIPEDSGFSLRPISSHEADMEIFKKVREVVSSLD